MYSLLYYVPVTNLILLHEILLGDPQLEEEVVEEAEGEFPQERQE